MSLRVGSVTPRLFTSTNVTFASVAATSTASQTFTVNGLQTDMAVVVNVMTLTSNFWPLAARVSAANTLQLDIQNTGAAGTPNSSELRIIAF